MIIAVDEVMKLPEFFGQTESTIAEKLNAAELMIRAYTNNSFQNRFVRFHAESLGNRIIVKSGLYHLSSNSRISQ